MKKNRPGHADDDRVRRPSSAIALTDLVFRETTTIGVRYQEMSRECLEREMVTVETPLGAVRFKVARRDGARPERAARVRRLARSPPSTASPIKDVQALAHKAWLRSTAIDRSTQCSSS